VLPSLRTPGAVVLAAWLPKIVAADLRYMSSQRLSRKFSSHEYRALERVRRGD